MSVDKVILRAFLSTLAAIGVLLLFMILSLCAVFPSTMMEITYDFGMESSSIHFAERAYKNSADVYFIAYATEVAIEEGKEEKILSCGEKFLSDKKFSQYCSAKEQEQEFENYEQFIYGQVCVAQYDLGSKTDAIERAYQSLNGTFPKNNALVAVLMTSIAKKDAETVGAIKEKLDAVAFEGEEEAYRLAVLSAIGE